MIEVLFQLQPFFYFLIVVCLTLLLNNKSPFVCYCLWMMVLLKLMLPYGVFDLAVIPYQNSQPFHIHSAEKTPILSKQSTAQVPLDFSPNQITRIQTTLQMDNLGLDPNQYLYFYGIIFLSVCWFAISAIVLLVKIISYVVWYHSLSKMKEVSTGGEYELYKECCHILQLSFQPKLLRSHLNNHSPFVTGLTNRTMTVVIPESLMDSCSQQELKIILSHELCHVKNRDHWVNLVRFISLCLFHIHPIRIIADKQIVRYREMCRDMDVIQRLKIHPKLYANTLVSVYEKIVLKHSSPVLCSTLFVFRSSLLQRVEYILHSFQPTSMVHAMINVFVISLCVFFMMFNLTGYSQPVQTQNIELSELDGIGSFPDPVSHEHLVSGYGGPTQVQGNEVWYLDQMRGLFVFEYTEEGSFEKRAEFPIESNGKLQIQCFFVEDDLVFIGFGGFNENDDQKILILNRVGDGFELIGTIPGYNTFTLLKVGNTLWAGGLYFTPSGRVEGLLTLYDIHDLSDPIYLDEIFLDILVTKIEVFPEFPESVFVSHSNSIERFAVGDSLQSLQFIPLHANCTDLSVNDNRELLITTLQTEVLADIKQITMVHKLIETANSEFTITHSVRFADGDKNLNSSFKIFPADDGFIIPLSHSGVYYLINDNNHFQVQEKNEMNNTGNLFVIRDKLFTISVENIFEYDLSAITGINTGVLDWQVYQGN